MFNIISNRKSQITFMIFAVFMVMAVPAFAQEPATVNLDIDTDQFITAINTWLPLAISIIVIGVGIRGAFALAQFVGKLITDAFSRSGS